MILVLQAENCADPEVIFSFLHANEIGKTHSEFYISYALLMESKNKVKAANELLNLGISRSSYVDFDISFHMFLTHCRHALSHYYSILQECSAHRKIE